MSHIELLELQHSTNLFRQRSQQSIVAHIQHSQILQQPDLHGQARSELIIQQNYLIQRVRHVAQTRRHAAMEFVVGQNYHRHRRVAEVVRELEGEPVVVDENGVQILIEQLFGHGAFKLIESQI